MISFFKEPTEVAKYLKSKKAQIHFDYDEIMHDAHKKVFTVAKVTNMSLLNDMKASLESAFKNGKSFEAWKEDITPTLKKHGWIGKTKVTDPKTGEIKEIFVGSKRLRNIYNTNMRTAYAKARYQNQMESLGEYFRYSAVLDQLTRPSHARLHGTTLPKTDPFWNINYPPNGWGCRCKVQVLTKEECKRRGIKPLDSSKGLINIAHKDFAYNPGKVDKIDDIFKERKNELLKTFKNQKLKEKLSSFEHERDFYVWQKGLDDAIDELLVKKNLNSPIEVFGLGVLSDFVIKKAKEVLKINTQTKHIVGDKKGVLHIRPERKSIYNQDLRIDEIRQIVKVLDDKNTPISIDIKKKNIIFWFDDKIDKTKINKIIVDLNYNLKKFGVTNYMISVGKVDKTSKDDKNFIKIR